jgi:hypothetical protein
MANNEWDRDRDRNRDWDRDRHRESERERDRGYDPEQRRQELGVRGEGGYEGRRAKDYGSRAGWGGQGFSQGSFGSFGGQGERLYTQYGGQGWGAEHGYVGRETGGGMSLYSSPSERDRYSYGAGMGTHYPDRGEQWDRGERERSESRDRDRDREPWAPDWGGQGFSGREGGWGGYGSYDRERGNWGTSGAGPYDRDRGFRHGGSYHESSEDYNAGRHFGGYASSGGYNTGASTFGPGNYGGESRRWDEGRNWRESGNFAGRGPRNWQRSDERIGEDINERLTHHPDIDASDIEVEVTGGNVTLKGKVDDRRAKRLAEDIAESVSGVHDVRNEIKVSRGFFGTIGDALTGRSGDEDDRDRTGTSQSATTSGQKPGELTGTKK